MGQKFDHLYSNTYFNVCLHVTLYKTEIIKIMSKPKPEVDYKNSIYIICICYGLKQYGFNFVNY